MVTRIMMFERKIIRVPLSQDPDHKQVLMVIRDDYSADDTMVVFARPEVLKSYLEAEGGFAQSEYHKRKHDGAVACFAKAAINADTCILAGPEEHPVPLAIVSCYEALGNRQIAFTDGITRSAVLIEKGAEFIPLQVSKNEASRLDALVGNGMPPLPAERFVVLENVRSWEVYHYHRRKFAPK